MIGWRGWVVEDGLLHGTTFRDIIWNPCERFEAACRMSLACDALGIPACCAPPTAGCSCGVHALRECDQVQQWLVRPHHGVRVIGQVSLWGRVIVCEHGWRSQYAYPYQLYVKGDRGLAARLRSTYIVDVEVV